MKFFILFSLFLYINLIFSIIPIKKIKNNYESNKNISKMNEMKDYFKFNIINIQDIFTNILNKKLNKDEINDINNLYWIML